MKESLIGVFIGFFLSLIAQYFFFRLEYKKWKKEKMADSIKSEKERINAIYKNLINICDKILENPENRYMLDISNLLEIPIEIGEILLNISTSNDFNYIKSNIASLKLKVSNELRKKDEEIKAVYEL
jgi:hypothetical protein